MTTCKVYFRVPSKCVKKTKPILSVIEVEGLSLDKSYEAVMESLHKSQENYLMPILVLLQGGKV